jgi:GTP-binding protein
MDFFDHALIFVKAGNGGNGSAHFHREKFNPSGGPDGGDGGRGGSIYFEVDQSLNTLVEFHYRQKFRAESGESGHSNRQHGKSGEDLIIKVPAGTLVRDKATDTIIADLTEQGQRKIVARGGRGGLGNTHFATPTNQAPREAQLGEPGEEQELHLELKLIADVGLVGMPNAGKSTLLSVVTAARPKIANYPFTTLTPNLGVAVVGDPAGGDSQSFVMADIPGLIEGAAEGVGLGHDFLRHVERTRLLLHLIDGDNIAMDPWDEFDIINHELQSYRPEMAELPKIVVFTKMDLPNARDRWPDFKTKIEHIELPVFAISAPLREGVSDLINFVAAQLQELPLRTLPEVVAAGLGKDNYKTFRPVDDESFTISREDNAFVVHGRRVERIAAMTDPENEEALARLEKLMRKLGVFDALEKEGIAPGNMVRFGNLYEMEWGEG